MTDQLQALLSFCASHARICPKPMRWKELWEMLPDRKQKGFSWVPPSPLILVAWWETSALEKRHRFEEHLIYAENKGILEKVAVFLRSLSEDEWFHKSD